MSDAATKAFPMPVGSYRKSAATAATCGQASLLPTPGEFHGSRDAQLDERTHDLSSSVDDSPTDAKLQTVIARERKWQIIANFHTDKGIVETSTTVVAHNPLAAIDELEVQWSRISEMYALTVTPAPLEVN